MPSLRLLSPALACCCLAGSSLALRVQDPSAEPVPVLPAAAVAADPGWIDLAFEPVPEPARRAGAGFELAPPERCVRWQVDGLRLLLFDLDGDGTISVDGRDGLGLEASPYVVHLPNVLLVGEGQYRLTISGEQFFYERIELGLEPQLVADAAHLNELRIGAGRRPAWLDAEVSRGCSNHIAYLVANHLADGWYNPSTTIERPGWAGRTKAGDLAAGQSIYAFGCLDLHEAIDEWSRTALHAALLMDPRLSALGVAQEAGISMLRHFHDGDVVGIQTLPVDGARGVSPAFHPKGERPSPVTGTLDAIGCGTPVIAYLPENCYRRRVESFNLRTLDRDGLPYGREIPAYLSTPMRAANPYWAQNYGCLVLIPETPLKPLTSYRASLRLQGFPESVRWSFETSADSDASDDFTTDLLEGAKKGGQALEPLRFEERLRSAGGLARLAPKEGWQVEFDKQVFYFFDMDADGRLRTDGSDGLGTEGAAFVVPLRERLLTRAGQLRLRFEEGRLEYLVEALPLPKKLVAASALLTELRIGAGVEPVVLDQVASHHAASHARYLIENQMNDGSAGLLVHGEDPKRPAYTPAGARAAQVGLIACGASGLDFALWNWFTGAYHRPLLIDPELASIGVAYEDRAAVLVPGQSLAHPQSPWVHPAPDSIGVPQRFSRDGEVPNPVLGSKLGKGLGFPILVRLPRADFMTEVEAFRLLDEAGAEVDCAHSSPAEPANLLRSENAGCAFLIPRKPLAAGARYRVEFSQGGRTPLKWEFTTKGR